MAGADSDGHGTHVAGIAAGSGASGEIDPLGFLLGQGVAIDATIGSVQLAGTVQQRIETSAQQGPR